MASFTPRSRRKLPRLQALRIERMLTQEQLAARSGVGVATIIRAEGGQLVNALTAARLAKGLDVGISDLEQG